MFYKEVPLQPCTAGGAELLSHTKARFKEPWKDEAVPTDTRDTRDTRPSKRLLVIHNFLITACPHDRL